MRRANYDNYYMTNPKVWHSNSRYISPLNERMYEDNYSRLNKTETNYNLRDENEKIKSLKQNFQEQLNEINNLMSSPRSSRYDPQASTYLPKYSNYVRPRVYDAPVQQEPRVYEAHVQKESRVYEAPAKQEYYEKVRIITPTKDRNKRIQEAKISNENNHINTSYVSDGSLHKTHQNAYLNQYKSLSEQIKPRANELNKKTEQSRVTPIRSFIREEVKEIPISKPQAKVEVQTKTTVESRPQIKIEVKPQIKEEQKSQIQKNTSLSRVSCSDIRYGIRSNAQIKSKQANLTIQSQKKNELQTKQIETKIKISKTVQNCEGIKKIVEEVKEKPIPSQKLDAFSSYQINFFKDLINNLNKDNKMLHENLENYKIALVHIMK